MYKKLLSFFLIFMISCSLLLAACSGGSGDEMIDGSEFTDEEREAYIMENMVGNGTIVTADDFGEPLSTQDPEDPLTGIPANMHLVMSNDNFDFFFNFENTTFVVSDKRGGGRLNYYSSAAEYGIFTNDTTTYGAVDYLSNVTIEAYDSTNKRYEFTSYSDSVEGGTFYVVRMDDNTLRLIYTIGNDDDKNLVPEVLTEETYLGIIDTLQTQYEETGDASFNTCISDLRTLYKEVNPDTLSLEDRERYATYYPAITMRTLYVTRTLTMRQRALIREAMTAAGFTVEDLKHEMEVVEYSGPARSVLYTIPLDITLNDDGISLSVDTSVILGPTQQKLYKISIAHSFGTASVAKTGGDYMILPDGSGAYVTSSGTMSTDTFRSRVYSTDLTFDPELDTGKTEQMLSGYFVYNRGVNGGFLAVLESGQSHAFVRAQAAEQGQTYSAATANFEIVYIERDFRTYSRASSSSSDSSSSGSGSSSGSSSSSSSSSSSGSGDTEASGVITSKTHINELVTARYIIDEPSEDNQVKGYAEYASEFRSYLQQKGAFPTERVQQEDLLFYAELIGAIDKTVYRLGFPVNTTVALTRYSDIRAIVDKLVEEGIPASDIVVRYKNWSNGGYFNTLNDRVRLVGALGSEEELRATAQYLSDAGIGFYPEADFLFVHKNSSALDYSHDVARRIDSSVARVNLRDYASGEYVSESSTTKTVLSPIVLADIGQSFEASFSSVLGTKQIALAGIGQYLNSSYRTNATYTRIDAQREQESLLKYYKDAGYDIMVDTGNDYTWAYASHILNLPTGSSEYMSATRSVPFVQLVLHGYINYSTAPLNETADYRIALLTVLETGSGLHFKWMSAEDSVFVDSALTNAYSYNYNDSMSEAVAMYKEASEILAGTANQEITDHAMLDAYIRSSFIGDFNEDSDAFTRESTNGVYMTTYENGLQVAVNYNCYDVELNDADRTVIGAYSYIYRIGGDAEWQAK